MGLDVFTVTGTGLSALFGSRSQNILDTFNYVLTSENKRCLVIDVNHRWPLTSSSQFLRIMRPKSVNHFLDFLQDLLNYVHPHLDLVLIADLPLYFRDYYSGKKIQTQNMRAFGAALAIIKNLSKLIPVVFTTYPSGIHHKEPIYYHHCKYYADSILYISSNQAGDITIDNILVPSQSPFLLKSIHHNIE